jgi:phosphoenolpyruvate phosphomutase
VDTLDPSRRRGPNPRDLVVADRRFSGEYLDDGPVLLRRVAQDVPPEAACGEWIGLLRLSARGSELVLEEIGRLEAEGLLETADLPLLLTRLAARHPVEVKYVAGGWLDVDTLGDLAEARNFG